MQPQDMELKKLYLTESEETLQALEELLFRAESGEGLRGALPVELFRLVHTFKGSSAMMGLTVLEHSAHLLENLLSQLRSGLRAFDPQQERQLLDLCFASQSYFRQQLAALRGGEEPVSSRELEEKLILFAEKDSLKAGPAAEAKAARRGIPDAEQAPETEPCQLRLKLHLKKCAMPNLRLSLIIRSLQKYCQRLQSLPAEPEKHPELSEELLEKGAELRLTPLAALSESELLQKLAALPFYGSHELLSAEEQAPLPAEAEAAEAPEAMVYVRQSRISELLNMTGELLTLERELSELLAERGSSDAREQQLLAQQHRYLNELQSVAAELGMVETGQVFSQMRRLIRSMTEGTGKKITVITEGADLSVDRSVIKAVTDALIHIVRNAADHGIESPEKRAAQGKCERGTITLKAKKQSGRLLVSVSDDGAGIDRAAVLKKAAASGLIREGQKTASDREIFQLLASSGFTTSSEVTKYSGRGVGLDAAAKKIREAGGEIIMKSTAGAGTTFSLLLPATLSVLKGLQLEIFGGTVILPVSCVSHVAFDSFERTPQGEILRDGELYSELLAEPAGPHSEKGSGSVIFLLPELGNYYLKAEAAGELEEMQIKPLPEYITERLGRDCLFTGCSIRSNSAIVCVLDIHNLISINEEAKGASA